ncbi:hypothetical protein GCM10023196_052580 [Actinoallomurus vinaceus]|uniref:Uncharacterized protein n=1 Tax=Actinoallomurus vinaceus TaxID=1080074 RepID=A0ABP8UDW9_9ACTN
MALTHLDVQRVGEAYQAMQWHRGWLIMWSLWHRTFTAFCCFSVEPLVLDAPTIEHLLPRLREVELHHSITHPTVGATAVPARSAPHGVLITKGRVR